MDASGWDRRYAATELLWSAEPNRFVDAELVDLPPGRAARLPGLWVDLAERVRRPVVDADREAIDTLVRAHRLTA